MNKIRSLINDCGAEHAAVRHSFLQHFSTILTNILQTPTELKFRKIRETNATLKAQFFAFPNSREILDIAGFDKTGRGDSLTWVFMQDPESDREAFAVLEGVLKVVKDEMNKPAASTSSFTSAAAAASSARNSEDGEMDPAAIAAIVDQVKRMQQQQRDAAAASNCDDIDVENDASSLQRTQQQQRVAEISFLSQQNNSTSSIDAPPPPQLAPKFFSFSKSVGFQMRLDALRERMKDKSSRVTVVDDDDDDAASSRKGNGELESFIVNLLLDSRNSASDCIPETLKIIKTLIQNMQQDPTQAKFRLLNFENKLLGRFFFPVPGAAELFIGVLGFSVADEGLAKEIGTSSESAAEEEAQIEAALTIVAKVEDGLKVRADLENEERRRLFAQSSLNAEREAARREMGLQKPKAEPKQDASGSANKPRKMIPIADALAYLLGKEKE